MTATETGDAKADATANEAARWHARLLSGAMTDENRAELRGWLAAAEANRRAFAEIEDALGAADQIGEGLLSEEFDDQLNRLARPASGARRLAMAAASVAFILVAAGAFFLSPLSQNQPLIVATDIGETREIVLADGSKVELNTATVLEVNFDRRVRSVSLAQGEAVFSVDRDKNRPFVVSTPQAVVTVSGTIFDVMAIDGKAIVSVLSGAVDVKPSRDGAVTLLPGESLIVGEDGLAGVVARFDPRQALAWRMGKLRFQETALSEVVRELNRYFAKPIVVSDPSIDNLPVTGEFNFRDQDAAVRALSIIFSLEAEREPDRIVLYPESEK